MNELYINTAITSLLFLVIFGVAELAYVKFSIKVEITRKFVHIGSGLLCLSFPFYIVNIWLVLLLSINFLVLLIISKKFNFLKSINNVDRKTYGSYLFPVTIFVMYSISTALDNLDFYFLPLLIFAISDPMGALVGKKYPIKKYTVFNQQKSLGGALAFFTSALLICFSYFYCFSTIDIITVILVLTISSLATITEGLSFKGTDNITVPLIVALIVYLFL